MDLGLTPVPVDAYLTHAKLSSFRKKLDTAKRIIGEAKNLRVVVTSSWGKDSVALCALAEEVLGRAPVLHLESPYKLPGWEHVAAYFAARLPVYSVPAKRTLAEYIEWCREIGLPHERSKSTRGKVVSEIKRDVASQWCLEHGMEAQAMGLRIEEGGPRARVLRRRGPIYSIASGDVRVCPLAYWSSRDVWAFIFSRELPYCSCYDCETHGATRETIRNTGWLSTDGAERGRIAWLRAHYPEQYRQLVTAFPHVAALS